MTKRFAIYNRQTGELVEGGFFSKTAAQRYMLREYTDTTTIRQYVVKEQK